MTFDWTCPECGDVLTDTSAYKVGEHVLAHRDAGIICLLPDNGLADERERLRRAYNVAVANGRINEARFIKRRMDALD